MKQGTWVGIMVSRNCKVICCGRSRGQTPWPPLVLHSHYKPTNEGHVAAKHWATCPHLIRCQHNMCQHPIGQPQPIQMHHIFPLPCHHDGTTLPRGHMDCTDRYSQHPKFLPVWLGGQITISPPYGLHLRK